MFMKDDKNKKAATIIISKIRKEGQPEKLEEASIEDGAYQDSDELVMVSEEILSALEQKDAKALSESLKSFISMCEDEED